MSSEWLLSVRKETVRNAARLYVSLKTEHHLFSCQGMGRTPSQQVHSGLTVPSLHQSKFSPLPEYEMSDNYCMFV